MVYHDPFRRLVFSGTLYTTESWSCSLCMGHQGVGDGVQPGLVSEAIRDAAVAFFSTSYVGAGAFLNTIKYNLIGVDGKYVDTSSSVRYDFETPTNGSGSTTVIPQAALAVTLKTAASRGLAHAGRFYMPLISPAVQADGRLSTAQVTTIAAVATSFLNALNADDSEWRLAVVSNIGAGAQNHVTNVSVGRVIDTMRSRRKNLVEDPWTDVALEA